MVGSEKRNRGADSRGTDKIGLILILLGLFCLLRAEKVGYFQCDTFPELYDTKTITVPSKTVAMGKEVRVGDVGEIFTSGAPSSIFILIDNSVSMYKIPSIPPAADVQGTRYTVTSKLIDSIYAKNPAVEIGLAVFGSNLYFDPVDDPIFKMCSYWDKGAYIPLLQLNKSYNGESGYDILQKYLTVKQYGIPNSHINLKYEPSNPRLKDGMTNINVAFESVKEAMSVAKYAKERHFVVFLSDGSATVPMNDTKMFINGDGVPTTFTVYFSETGVHGDIVAMTENIKTNNYSSSNEKSKYWSMKTSEETLMKLLMENVVEEMISSISNFTPKALKVNGLSPIGGWDGIFFTFENLFPLLGKTTDFAMEIEYEKSKDSITIDGDTIHLYLKDTTHEVNFTVEVGD